MDFKDPKYNHTKGTLNHHVMVVIFKMALEKKISEIKVVTYVDLITSVAGVPSFLLIIYKYFLKSFEKFYSDFKMTTIFKDNSRPEPPPDPPSDDKKTAVKPKDYKQPLQFHEFDIYSQLYVFLAYKNPFVMGTS